MIKLEEVLKNIEPISKERMKKKEKELSSLLKIPKGLGKLEELAIQLEGIQENYAVNKRMALVMAADNGVEREGVSFSKRIITQYVVEAMIKGHSSINALAKTFGADVVAVDLGIDKSCDINNEVDLSGIINEKLMEFGTNNIVEGPAMTYEIAKRAIEIGIEKVDEFEMESFNPVHLPDYMEIVYNGNIVPLSKWMFDPEEIVVIVWKEISNLSVKNNKMIEGYSLIDAFVINNDEVKDYVEAREINFRKAKAFLESKGYEVDRSYFGSEDGEAILYRKKGAEDWHFLCHLDPLFVEIEDVEGFVENIEESEEASK